MAEDSPSQPKTCLKCGLDVSAVPRVRDQSGRYVCREYAQTRSPCARGRAALAQLTSAPAAGAGADPIPLADEDPFDLLADVPEQAGAAPVVGGLREMPTCPKCDEVMSTGAVICINCGFNAQTGTKGRTKVVKEKAPKDPSERKLPRVAIGEIGIVGAFGFWMVAGLITVPAAAMGPQQLGAALGLVISLVGIGLYIKSIVHAFQEHAVGWGVMLIASPFFGTFGTVAQLYYLFTHCERRGVLAGAMGAGVVSTFIWMAMYWDKFAP